MTMEGSMYVMDGDTPMYTLWYGRFRMFATEYEAMVVYLYSKPAMELAHSWKLFGHETPATYNYEQMVELAKHEARKMNDPIVTERMRILYNYVLHKAVKCVIEEEKQRFKRQPITPSYAMPKPEPGYD